MLAEWAHLTTELLIAFIMFKDQRKQIQAMSPNNFAFTFQHFDSHCLASCCLVNSKGICFNHLAKRTTAKRLTYSQQ